VELLQFTSLCDMNGKEIYDGDLILLYGRQEWNKNERPVQVLWAEDIAGFRVKKQDMASHLNFRKLAAEHYEVIGNIFESPELLGKYPDSFDVGDFPTDRKLIYPPALPAHIQAADTTGAFPPAPSSTAKTSPALTACGRSSSGACVAPACGRLPVRPLCAGYDEADRSKSVDRTIAATSSENRND
jgi:hypothetical protein